MLQIISIVVLVVSFFTLLMVFFSKASSLANTLCPSCPKEGILTRIKRIISKISIFKASWWNRFLQKALSKIRVLVLKIENQIGKYLSRLRKKSSTNGEEGLDDNIDL